MSHAPTVPWRQLVDTGCNSSHRPAAKERRVTVRRREVAPRRRRPWSAPNPRSISTRGRASSRPPSYEEGWRRSGRRRSATAHIVAIPGSLRRGSWNAALARAAAEAAPPGSAVEVLSIRGIPLYDADEEAERGIPAAVARMKDLVAAADGVILATPEYNNSLPGVLKNAIDWLSRPPPDARRVFSDRPFALMGASPGRGGTILAQAAWLPVLRTLGVRFWSGGRLQVSGAGQVFDAEGRLVDAEVRRQLEAFLAGFVRFVGR